MCLYIKSLKKVSGPNKKIKGYKIIRKDNKVIHTKIVGDKYVVVGGEIIGSAIKDICRHTYKIGTNISSRKSTKLTKEEISNRTIFNGFHVFTNLKDAKAYIRFFPRNVPEDFKIIEVWINSDDVVDRGCVATSNLISKKLVSIYDNIKEVVVTKLIVRSLKPVVGV